MELRLEFASKAEWDSWLAEHESACAAWRRDITSRVGEAGLTEPLTGLRIPAAEVIIAPGNLAESLAERDLNARKRALLSEIEALRLANDRLASLEARVFVAEATTRVARIVSALYPYILATEYLPQEERKLAMFPVPHADLTDLYMPDAVFDIAINGHVLNHMEHPRRALAELARVLKPGGVFVGTFAFADRRDETAPFEPVNEQTLARGFQFGWDILRMCREAGFMAARMVLHASSLLGICGNQAPGVFVLVAMKDPQRVAMPPQRFWPAARITHVVGLIGVPRSGTTMAAAVLDAHDDVVSIYEPWNANKKAIADGKMTVDAVSLCRDAERLNSTASTMVVKETGLDLAYLNNVAELLAAASTPLSAHLLIIMRNPFHCFLSEIEGRMKWWGASGLQINADTFQRWASRTIDSLLQMLHIASALPSVFVFYEALVVEPAKTIAILMEALDMHAIEGQFRIKEKADLRNVRGDLSLVQNARDVTAESIAKREAELDTTVERFSSSLLFGRIRTLQEVIAVYSPRGVLAKNSVAYGQFDRALRECCTDLS